MNKRYHRWEVVLPEKGNSFVPIFVHGNQQVVMRIAGGRSFVSGFDTPLFDGVLQFEIKFQALYFTDQLLGEATGAFILKLRSLFPEKSVEWDKISGTVQMSLMEDTETPVNVSSQNVIEQISKLFGMDPAILQAQNKWTLVEY